MLKSVITFVLFLTVTYTWSQANSEVYLATINFNPTGMEVEALVNISNDSNYDNQPSFLNQDTVLFAGNNQGQTDIFSYSIPTDSKEKLAGSLGGGEYSPTAVPNTSQIAAVRLDTTGLQRLYSYSPKTNSSKLLIDDLKVAYFTFYNPNTLVGCYIDEQENGLNLFVFKQDENKSYTLLKNVGRSFHKVPGQDMVSYTAINQEGNHDIYLLDMQTYESFFVTQLPIGIQDYAWLDDSRIILGSNSSLYIYDTFGREGWEKMADLQSRNINNITRLAVSPNGKLLAIAAQPID